MRGCDSLSMVMEAGKSAKGPKLAASVKRKINDKIHDICKGLHDKLPLNEIFQALEDNGVMPLQEDGTRWSGIISLPENKQTNFSIELGDASTGFDLHGEKAYQVYENASLVLNLYRYKDTGRIEVVSYVG